MKRNKALLLSLFIVLTLIMHAKDNVKIFCNPLNLNYRFQIKEPSYREAADPTVVWFKDRYYLFASMSGGYWHSKDLAKWSFVETNQIPTEDYAPTAIVIQDTMYFMASSSNFNFRSSTGKKNTIYKSADPLTGDWKIAKDSIDFGVWDPALFLDDDQRLYFYWGCHPAIPIRGIELDYKNNFKVIGNQVDLVSANKKEKGWEVYGENNEDVNAYSWIEGSWMNKYNGKYYLQYSAPGTQFKSYCDAVYVSEKPLGPFKLQDHNPFSYKPAGFIGGAGHGSTFKDKYGNYWHMSSMSISVKNNFERRIGLWPAFFDNDGVFYTYTGFGDYPHKLPTKKMKGPEDYKPESMLLSYNKTVEVSSQLDNHSKKFALDEDVRTCWSATSGNKGEWLLIDLEKESTINALQLNFFDQNTSILGRHEGIFFQYKIECSKNKKDWSTIVDKTQNKTDCPHDFIELNKKVSARYIRITNYHVPDGNFAISDFRIFGLGNGAKPQLVDGFSVSRDKIDARKVTIKWKQLSDVTGYNIRYGIAPNKLYQNYQIIGNDSVVINSLNKKLDYYFTIDSFNENGITKGTKVIQN